MDQTFARARVASPLRIGVARFVLGISLAVALSACFASDPDEGKFLSKPSLAWSVPINFGQDGAWPGTPTVAGGMLFIAELGNVSALDAATGARRWTTNVRKYPAPVISTIVVRGDRVLFAEYPDVMALDIADGHVLWRFEPDSDASVAENVADDNAYYVGTRTHKVYGLDLQDGHPRWVTDLGESWQYNGMVHGLALSGDTLYVTITHWLVENGYLQTAVVVALRRGDGQELWRYEMPGSHGGVMNAPVVIGRNLLISEGLSGAIFALDRFTGKEVWRVDAVPGGWFPDRATISGDTAFVASTDTHVYALDLRDGHTYWRSSNDAGSFSAGIPCGQFVLANAFGVMAYDRATGRYLGELPTKTWRGDLYPTSHFARDDKRVYITGNKLAWSVNCR